MDDTWVGEVRPLLGLPADPMWGCDIQERRSQGTRNPLGEPQPRLHPALPGVREERNAMIIMGALIGITVYLIGRAVLFTFIRFTRRVWDYEGEQNDRRRNANR